MNKLTEQIMLMMKDSYYPSPMTHGEFLKKRMLEEFIKLSGMPLGHETLVQALEFTEKEIDKTIAKLTEEGYISEIDSPASFLFPGKSGNGYQLIMDEKEASIEAEEKIKSEKDNEQQTVEKAD